MSSSVISLEAEIAEYNSARNALIAREKVLRHGSYLPVQGGSTANQPSIADYDFRQRLSPTAKQAAAIVARVRTCEAEKVWKKAGDEEGDVFPGMCFTLAKERMETSALWKIVKKFPKGALLHAHLEAMVDSECAVSPGNPGG